MFYYQILIWTIHLTACRGGSLLDLWDKADCYAESVTDKKPTVIE